MLCKSSILIQCVLILLVISCKLEVTQVKKTATEITASAPDINPISLFNVITPVAKSTFSLNAINSNGLCDSGSTIKISGDLVSVINLSCVDGFWKSPLLFSTKSGTKNLSFIQTSINGLTTEKKISYTLAIAAVVPVVVPVPVPVPTPVATIAAPTIIAPVFKTMASSMVPSIAVRGESLTFSTVLSSTVSVTNLNVDIEIREYGTEKVLDKKVYSATDFTANINKSFIYNFVVPTTTIASNLYIVIGVFNDTWNKVYYWDNQAALLTMTNIVQTQNKLPLLGVNLSGGEFNSKPGARLYYEYVYPNNDELDYLASRKIKIIRVPFTIFRLQPKRNGPLAASELTAIDAVVNYAKTKGITVLLDPHNYGYMNDDLGVSRIIGVDPLMPASFLANFWGQMSMHYKSSTNVMFNLMNEPHSQTAIQWKNAAVESIKAIRATGATQKILIPGTSWTGAHSWVKSGNAAAWTGFSDINFAYEVHQYLDIDSSGTHSDCIAGSGNSRLTSFTDWARTNGVKGFLGEFGWANNFGCAVEGYSLVNTMALNNDVWLGGTYWSSGPWMSAYIFTSEPIKVSGIFFDRSAFTIFHRFVATP